MNVQPTGSRTCTLHRHTSIVHRACDTQYGCTAVFQSRARAWCGAARTSTRSSASSSNGWAAYPPPPPPPRWMIWTTPCTIEAAGGHRAATASAHRVVHRRIPFSTMSSCSSDATGRKCVYCLSRRSSSVSHGLFLLTFGSSLSQRPRCIYHTGGTLRLVA